MAKTQARIAHRLSIWFSAAWGAIKWESLDYQCTCAIGRIEFLLGELVPFTMAYCYFAHFTAWSPTGLLVNVIIPSTHIARGTRYQAQSTLSTQKLVSVRIYVCAKRLTGGAILYLSRTSTQGVNFDRTLEMAKGRLQHPGRGLNTGPVVQALSSSKTACRASCWLRSTAAGATCE